MGLVFSMTQLYHKSSRSARTGRACIRIGRDALLNARRGFCSRAGEAREGPSRDSGRFVLRPGSLWEATRVAFAGDWSRFGRRQESLLQATGVAFAGDWSREWRRLESQKDATLRAISLDFAGETCAQGSGAARFWECGLWRKGSHKDSFWRQDRQDLGVWQIVNPNPVAGRVGGASRLRRGGAARRGSWRNLRRAVRSLRHRRTL